MSLGGREAFTSEARLNWADDAESLPSTQLPRCHVNHVIFQSFVHLHLLHSHHSSVGQNIIDPKITNLAIVAIHLTWGFLIHALNIIAAQHAKPHIFLKNPKLKTQNTSPSSHTRRPHI